MQLKHKIASSIAVISLIILLIVSFVYSNLSHKSVMEHEKSVIKTMALESARDIKLNLLAKLDSVKTISTAPIVLKSLKESNLECLKRSDETMKEHLYELNRKWKLSYDKEDEFVKLYLNNPLAQFLKKQQNVFKGVYGEIFITNTHGAIIATTGKLTTFAHSHKYWWIEAYADGKGKVFFDDRGFDASVNGYVIGVVIPIKDDGKIVGILKANINIMSSLNQVVEYYNGLNKGVLKIVRSKGSVILEESLPSLSTTINPKLLSNLENNEVGSRVIKDFSQEILVAYAPIHVSNDEDIIFGGRTKTDDSTKGNDGEIWHSVVSYDKNEALAESSETTLSIIYIGLLLTLFNWIVAFFIGRWISRPIEKLQQVQVEIQKQEEIMVAQSRHAAMGEMISMIAHQWRQPISVIAMGANNIMADIELEMIEEKKLKSYSMDIINKTQELSKTIDDFKNFFRPDKEISSVLVEDILEDVFSVMGQSLKNDGIEVTTEYHNGREIETYTRELMQVLINIIKNAKEAMDITSSKEKIISIYLYETSSEIKIKICDTGGGIKEEIMNEIFNPYFSTKSQNVGTGLGLYMSKTIIEKHLNGIISVYNSGSGACFELELPLKIERPGESDE